LLFNDFALVVFRKDQRHLVGTSLDRISPEFTQQYRYLIRIGKAPRYEKSA